MFPLPGLMGVWVGEPFADLQDEPLPPDQRGQSDRDAAPQRAGWAATLRERWRTPEPHPTSTGRSA